MSSIPKIIHYCWFGGKPKPKQIIEYISTWEKILPDYKIIEWNESNFDCNSLIWTKEALAHKKYAFVSDYVRLQALYNYGGIYMDTDVEVLKSFNSLLELPYFIGAENTIHGLNTATIGVTPQATWIKQCLDHYNNRHFIYRNKMDMRVNPELIKASLLKAEYKIKYISSFSDFINNEKVFNVFPASWFSPIKNGVSFSDVTTYAIHHYMATWEQKTNIIQFFLIKIKNILKCIFPHSLTKLILKKKREKRDRFFDN